MSTYIIFLLLFQVDEVLAEYILDDETYKTLMASMDDMATRGMIPEKRAKSSLKMFPTYVRHLPNGSGEMEAFVVLTTMCI